MFVLFPNLQFDFQLLNFSQKKGPFNTPGELFGAAATLSEQLSMALCYGTALFYIFAVETSKPTSNLNVKQQQKKKT